MRGTEEKNLAEKRKLEKKKNTRDLVDE